MAIQVQRAARRFGSFVALDDVSIDVPGGSLTALLGPSGSGKSTLLRVIAGLETPDSGSVLLDGIDVTRTPPQARGVGFVFQHYAAFRHMSVWDNVAFGLQVRKRPRAELRARVAELLQLVQLDGLSARYPSQLSGGQRQRMALARALAVRPEVLLLDEPFGALDARVRQELRDWLRRLHDEVQVTTLLVTHDQEEAMEVADRVVVMDHGRVQQVGSPRELYEQPANAFVMSFIGPVNHLDGTFVRPHDVVIHPVWPARAPAGREAVVERLTHLGFEVRVELALTEDGTRLWSQITRADLERLGLERHQRVYVESLRSRTFGAVAAQVEDDAEEAVAAGR